METYTPGPWKLAETVGDGRQSTLKRRIRSVNEGTSEGAVAEVYGARDGTVAAANARLIVAAPDLLDSLVQLLKEIDPNGTMTDPELSSNRPVIAARAAIAAVTEL